MPKNNYNQRMDFDKNRQDVALTPRKIEILEWIQKGKTNWEIGRILGITERTVKYHLAEIFKAFDVSNRIQALSTGIALGFVEPVYYETGRDNESDRSDQLAGVVDDFTSLYSYDYFLEQLEREITRAKRYRRPFSVLLLEIDNFIKYDNGNGDNLLKSVANLIREGTRAVDVVARVGGGRFAILAPEIKKSKAVSLANKLKKETIEYNVAINMSIAAFPVDGSDIQKLMIKADDDLKKAAQGKSLRKTANKTLKKNDSQGILVESSKSYSASDS